MRTHIDSTFADDYDRVNAGRFGGTFEASPEPRLDRAVPDDEYVPAKAYTDLKSAAKNLVELCRLVTMHSDIGRRSIIEAAEKLKALL